MTGSNINLQSFEVTCRVAFIGIIILLFFNTIPVFAQMKEVGDSELSQVSAQAGISYQWGNSRMIISADAMRFSDSDHNPVNWLEFNNFSISGPDGYFTLDTRPRGDIDLLAQNYNKIDAGTMTTVDNLTRSFVQFVMTDNTYPRTWNIGQLKFCDQELGSIKFDMQNVNPAWMLFATHGEGSSGLEFEYNADWLVQNFTYTYNTNNDALRVSGIHLAERASGASDDPANPATWEFSGQFRIGDIKGGQIDVDSDPTNAAASNPASYDVATLTTETESHTGVSLHLPMKGTIRAAEVNFGGNNFGPVAIDGITAHHLKVWICAGDF